LIDADLGVGNAHILQDLHPERTLIDVVQGRVEMAEARTHCRDGLDLLAGGSGVSSVASLAPVELRLLANGLARLDDQYSFQIIDSAAGISDQTLALAAASDIVLVVTTPDVTAMTDAYALLKVLFSKGYDGIPLVVVNRVTEPGEGERVAARIAQVSERFLRRELRWIGNLPEDRAVVRSVAARQPVSLCEPASEVAHALQQLALSLCDELERAPRRGLGTELLARLDAARA
jgi:flagellar biosynthesis protein FlhG